MAVAGTVLTNVLSVRPGELVPGTVALRGGLIAEAQPGPSGFLSARDLGCDRLIPGVRNLHTHNPHFGNVAATDLVREGAAEAKLSLTAAVAMETDAPARMARFQDRSRVAPGLRADLVRVRVHEGLSVVRQVWRAGVRVS